MSSANIRYDVYACSLAAMKVNVLKMKNWSRIVDARKRMFLIAFSRTERTEVVRNECIAGEIVGTTPGERFAGQSRGTQALKIVSVCRGYKGGTEMR